VPIHLMPNATGAGNEVILDVIQTIPS